MKSRQYSKLLNFAWYQLTWFTAVLGGSQYEWVMAILIVLHLGLVSCRRREAALMLSVSCLGALVDGLLAVAGYFEFAESGPLPIPLWHVGIWIGFAGTLRYSMSFMVARPRIMTLAAAVFAPLTYLAAQRLGAVTFPLGSLPTAIVIGLCWLTVTPLLVWLTNLADGELAPLSAQQSPQQPLPLATQER